MNLEDGCVYFCCSGFVTRATGVDEWVESQFVDYSPSECFTSYAFWLGRDSDELLSLV